MIQISHISDIAKIPPENLDEFLSDMRAFYASLILIKAAFPPGTELKKAIPHLDWIADGLGNVTPICNGKELFSSRIVKDELATP
jgi:hypothetical protein